MAITLQPAADPVTPPAPRPAAWAGIPSPIGWRVRIPAHDLIGTVTTYRLQGALRLLKVETPDGAQLDVLETECEPWSGQTPTRPATPPPAASRATAPAPDGPMQVQVMSMAEFARRIADDARFASTVSPESVQMLARDWLAAHAAGAVR